MQHRGWHSKHSFSLSEMVKLKKLSAILIVFVALFVGGFLLSQGKNSKPRFLDRGESSFLKLNIFSIKDVEINLNGVDCVDASKIQSEVNLTGKNLFLTDYESVSNSLKSKHLCIDAIEYDKAISGKVKINLNKRTPIARVGSYQKKVDLNIENLEATPSSSAALLDWESVNVDKLYLVDKNGFIFAEKEENIPRLYLLDQVLNLGSQLDARIFTKIALIFSKLAEAGITGYESKIDGIDLLVSSQPRIVFSLERDIKKQIASLQLILQKAKMDSKTIEIIDLRFDKPVIMYTSKQPQNIKEKQTTSSR